MKETYEMSGHELEALYQKKVEDHAKAGKAFSAAKKYFESIENKKGPITSKIALAAEGSVEARKWAAMASKEFEDYNLLLDDANGKFLDALVAYENEKVKIDYVRSLVSNRRSEVERFKG